MGFTLNQLEQERQIRKLQKKEDQDTKDYEKLSNLPKINNVELKGDKTTSDLGINADNVMLSDGVTSAESAISDLTIVKIDEAAANQTYQKQLTDLTNSYNALSDTQKERAYIMIGTTKFLTISSAGQFMHHDAGGSGLVATTLNCITHTAYNVNSSSITSIDSNTNTSTMALYA